MPSIEKSSTALCRLFPSTEEYYSPLLPISFNRKVLKPYVGYAFNRRVLQPSVGYAFNRRAIQLSVGDAFNRRVLQPSFGYALFGAFTYTPGTSTPWSLMQMRMVKGGFHIFSTA